jgi:hypothetical protein
MKSKIIARTIVFILFMLALASLASAAENITYTYKAITTGEIIVQNYTGIASQVNVTLPNTTWNIELVNNDSKFKVSFNSLNVTTAPVLDISAKEVVLLSQTYTGSVGTTNAFRYIPFYAYAFNISQLSSMQYDLVINYSAHASNVITPVIMKCDFNFTSGTSNTSTCMPLSTTDNDYSKLASASTTGFSAFFLTEDHCANGQTDYGEEKTDCGGACSACQSGGGSGPGGGGGGGGGNTPRIIYVTPTLEGASAQVFQGDMLYVEYKGKEYRFKVDYVGNLKVSLLSMDTSLTHGIQLGQPLTLGLESVFNRDVEVSMHVSNKFAILTFTLIEPKRFSFPLLPAKQRQAKQPAVQPTAYAPQVPTAYVPPTAAQVPAEAGEQAIQEIQVPESPINIWTIIFSLLFVIFLVGSIALYRARLHSLEKPPTVTRTGLEETGLPETSSGASKPVTLLSEGAAVPAEKAVEESKAPQKIEPKKEIKPKPVEVKISMAKKLELEKYIFHAFSQGFTDAQVKNVLVDKGWPEAVVDKVMSEVRLKK